MKYLCCGPGLSVVEAGTQGHVDAAGAAGGIAEEDDAFAIVCGPGEAFDCGLADRFDERCVKSLILPGYSAVVADGDLPVLAGSIVVAHVQEESAGG